MQSFEKHRDTRESMDYVEYLIFQILGQKIIEDFGVERYQDYVNEQLEIHLSEVQNAKVH